MPAVTPREILTLPALVLLAKSTERLIRLTRDGRRRLFSAGDFPQLGPLRENWRTIRAELDQVLVDGDRIPRFRDVHPRYTVVERWKTYFLLGYGWEVTRNQAQCPETTRLLKAVPGVRTAMFSILPPGTEIPPHTGIYAGVLRYHLGLKVPEPERCGFRIGDHFVRWREGEDFVFDNTYRHRAWNRGDDARVVLFLDFDRPLPRYLDTLNRAVIGQIAHTHVMRESRANLDAFHARVDAAPGGR